MLVCGLLSELVLVTFGDTLVEGTGSSCAAIHIQGALRAIALVVSQFVGRLLGNRLVDHSGQHAPSRERCTVVVLSMGWHSR